MNIVLLKEFIKIKYNMLFKNALMQNRFLIILFAQLILTALSFYAAFNIRFEFDVPGKYMHMFYMTLPLLLFSRVMTYYYFKIHSGSWRYVSMRDLVDTFKAIFSGSVLFLILTVFIYSLEEYPRSVFILEGLLNLTFIGGSRFLTRYYLESHDKGITKILKYALIVGAGKEGVLLLNEIRNNTRLGIHVAGFIDDNPYTKGINIQGIPVLGSTEDIPLLVKKHAIDEIIIAIPSASYKDIVRIMRITEAAQVKTQVLPNMEKLFHGGSFTSQLREVSCDDLLGRKVIKFSRESDRKHMDDEIKGKAVLVTGAGGSIGSELCRQIAPYGPRSLILYDRYENTLYDLELDLRREFPDLHLLPVIGDILDADKVDAILQQNNVDLIYHAAAYKHVPLMEREPVEAVRNNILGTATLSKLAAKNNVNKFVMISTDKAVNPANIMGTTKRVAELVVQSMNGGNTKYIAVRFGNVIGSNGSVIPLFKKQIAKGGPITVTHPEVTRYFMSIPEAVQLVMTAGALGKGGEIFLLDMGDPIKIVDLAHELIKLSGLEPGKDIDIAYTGLRPGEKLTEELYWKGEGIIPTNNKKITMLKPSGDQHANLGDRIELIGRYASKKDLRGIIKLLKEIVPESTIASKDIAFEEEIPEAATRIQVVHNSA
ncbi:MAG TPA: nucleoside-diphosphate sugar epimerase/dehydratase [Nitrospirota bacterium]|nr:nucleoside-diphosphate sugar epimerase/dehydratase [Nitrospirota bacterium]